MGMGEPLANFDNLLTSLEILTDQRGLDFSDRRITVSTCGLVPRIVELGQKSKANLAVSLHSVDDDKRSKLMPVNKKYSVSELLESCRNFPIPKRKRIMFEYILIKGLNDSMEDAQNLAAKLRNIPCKINLLPYNETAELPFQRPSEKAIERFQKTLWKEGYTVLVRSSRGSDISAACGQLAGKLNHQSRKENEKADDFSKKPEK
jgi:23S rRNA (adenine2503-C2)-methyltransferase